MECQNGQPRKRWSGLAGLPGGGLKDSRSPRLFCFVSGTERAGWTGCYGRCRFRQWLQGAAIGTRYFFAGDGANERFSRGLLCIGTAVQWTTRAGIRRTAWIIAAIEPKNSSRTERTSCQGRRAESYQAQQSGKAEKNLIHAHTNLLHKRSSNNTVTRCH